ncbi:MAG: flagellar motor protein MotB [Gammaproteobacteria bacterium]|nr:flagellar motor protein MotB [Gammaproteobacteria bacterium]
MADKSTQPIVVRKIVKGGGHHGGAWKVAYADFVTAMMAFFLLLWLLGSTTKDQRAAISEYFNNPSAEPGTSVTPSPNPVQGPGGSSTSMIQQDGTATPAVELPPAADATEASPDEESATQIAERKFRARMEEMLKELRELAEKSEILKQFQDQLLFDITEEGLRIQILDKDNRPMFDVGSATLKPHTTEILREIAKVINQVPSPVSITGYTDGRRLERTGYSNWELSTDRANAARRALTAGGMQEGKVSRIVGLASSKLFKPEDPMDPTNRRVSITVLSPQSAAAPNGSPAPTPAPAKPAAKS